MTHTLTFDAVAEARPGPKWKARWARSWPAYEAWFTARGGDAGPERNVCEAALMRHMPELVPVHAALVRLTGGGDRAARFLTTWCPPPYLGGCSLDAATGAVIGRCFPRHRAREFLSFLRTIEANVPADLDLHLVMDNYATHKTAAVRNWFAHHPRWHVHFTPTGASWLNQVERFFALLTEKQLRRGVHRSTKDLKDAISRYIDTVNADPRPFRWTKSADDILATIKRFCLRTLETADIQREISETSESGH